MNKFQRNQEILKHLQALPKGEQCPAKRYPDGKEVECLSKAIKPYPCDDDCEFCHTPQFENTAHLVCQKCGWLYWAELAIARKKAA